jgi:hypothetical protein
VKLLEFEMPPFARVVWASKEVEEEWAPKVQLAARAYARLEFESVIHGLRACTTAHAVPENLVSFTQFYAKKGLMYHPLKHVGSYSGFAHTHQPVLPGRPSSWFGVVARKPEDAYAFAHASALTEDTKDSPIDHDTIGALLGYPECCRKFFTEVWGAGYVDPVWQQAENCEGPYIAKREEHLIQMDASTPWETSPLLRYMGIRIVPQIPCSHDCKHSMAIAKDWIDLGRELKIEGMDEIEQFLRMPVEWDCLKGIAYVSTPIFKLETNSMTCYPRHVVQKEGTFRPKGGAKGLKFPFIPMGSDKFAHLFGGGSGC